MTDLLILLTVLAAAVPLYVFVGFPLLLWLLAVTVGRGPARKGDELPSVTMIVSCFNEADILPQKIANCLQINYPADRLAFLFVSDASTDATDDIVKGADDPRVRLLRQPERLGKTMGLNLAMAAIESDVVVFSDANAMYRPDAVRTLVAPFADPAVGYVVGAALYDEQDAGASGRAETLYWKYELWIKQQESRLHSVVGGDGAIYAIRRALFWPFDREDINDLVNPLQIVDAGHRGVFEPRAICIEHAAEDFAKEGRRKRRIVNRSFTAVLKHRRVLNPLRNPSFAFALWSHKVLRWLLAPFIALAMLGTGVLGLLGVFPFQWLLPPVLALVGLALVGFLRRDRRSQSVLTAVPYYFFLVAGQASLGLADSLRGRVKVTWDTPRAQVATDARDQAGQVLALAALVVIVATLAWSLWRLAGLKA